MAGGARLFVDNGLAMLAYRVTITAPLLEIGYMHRVRERLAGVIHGLRETLAMAEGHAAILTSR